MDDGCGSKRVWFERGVHVKPIRQHEVSVQALWAGKRDEKPIEFILETRDGYMTDREARRREIGGVLRYKVVSGCFRTYIS